MTDSNSIFSLKDYGSITFHFNELMDAKGISRAKLSKLANVRFEVADKWYSGEIERMDMDVLARVCFVLDCNVSDVITFEK